ncbi:YbgC/FadM family acyl-CoA thioesterase [Rubrobacter marinus]|uniref:YbgC/FadM family acyl-CoA thioesterase n=1 Tax=Rubrobacter marinus TaxID=2653852 RepID=A0A6G8Q0A6_9ACTN|nr:thioesterase family protein [Rubrobacter marinus]QIN79860.1 YbgC/FadM family acyl-CoA thioesterase [Rubrobacter marinus]
MSAPATHETKFRVRYGETDAQGIVNNSNYLSYFEVGRVEWLRAAGLSYRDLERAGYGFVVVEAHAFYKRAARFDDALVLKTSLADFGRASFWFEYEVLRDGETVATGRTRHGCIEIGTGRPSRVPEEFVARLSGSAP